MKWIGIWSGDISGDIRLDKKKTQDLCGAQLCPWCSSPYHTGTKLNIVIDNKRLSGSLYTAGGGAGIVSVDFLRAIGVADFEGCFSLGSVLCADGSLIKSHVSFTSKERTRMQRGAKGSELLECDMCKRVIYFSKGSNAKRYFLESELPKRKLFADEIHQLFMLEEIYWAANQGDRFKLERVRHDVPVLKEPKDGFSNTQLYPNPERRFRPDGSMVEIRYSCWTPIFHAGSEAKDADVDLSFLTVSEKATAPPDPSAVWLTYEAKLASRFVFKRAGSYDDGSRKRRELSHTLFAAPSQSEANNMGTIWGNLEKTGLPEIWSRHNGARLFFIGDSTGLLELYPMSRFEAITASAFTGDESDRETQLLVVGEIPKSGNKIAVVLNGSDRGSIERLEHDGGSRVPIAESIAHLLSMLEKDPVNVESDLLGGTFRWLVSENGAISQWILSSECPS